LWIASIQIIRTVAAVVGSAVGLVHATLIVLADRYDS
jgi:hypothetical protein